VGIAGLPGERGRGSPSILRGGPDQWLHHGKGCDALFVAQQMRFVE